LLQDAERRGVGDAVIGVAISQIVGNASTSDAKTGLSALAKAAAAGNLAAALRLVDIYRDGVIDGTRTVLRSDPARARKLLDGVSDRLAPGARKYQEILLDIARSGRGDYAGHYARIQEIAPLSRAKLMQRVMKANPNAFVGLVQLKLRDEGLFKGRADGLMTRATIRAVNDFCAALGVRDLCQGGPLAPTATFLLAHAL